MDQPDAFTIDCQDCVMRDTDACGDCVVSFVCGPTRAVVFDLAEARAVRLLADAGLVAPLRHRRAASGW